MKEKFKAFVEISRPLNCLMGIIAVMIGAIVEGADFVYYFFPIAIASLVAFSVMAGGNAVNDYFDWKVDSIAHKKRPIPSGRLTRSEAGFFALGTLLISLLLASLVNWICFLIALANIIVLISYEKKLKRKGISGNIAISYLVGSLFLFGGAAINIIQATIFLALLAFLSNLGREIIKDVEDLSGDKEERNTLPMLIGSKMALIVSSLSIATAILFSLLPIYYGFLNRNYLLIVILADVIFLIAILSSFKDARKAKILVKIGMIIALISFLVGGLT